MKHFLIGKHMWGQIDGTSNRPTDVTLLGPWTVNNSKIITWINNSVIASIGIQLTKFEDAKDIWDFLKSLYTQSDFAKQYQLESDIRALKQNDMGIQEFYSAMSILWDQLAETESAALRAFKPYTDRREEQRLVQFLMALRSDFEGLRGAILHRTPLPTVASVVHELMADETRQKTLANSTPNLNTPAVFAVAPNQSRFSNNQSRPSGMRVSADECAFCHKKGHWKSQCPLLQKKPQQNKAHVFQPQAHTPLFQPSFQHARPPSVWCSSSSSVWCSCCRNMNQHSASFCFGSSSC